MPLKLCNKPFVPVDRARLEARRLLATVYDAAVDRWKERCCERQAFRNQAWLLSRTSPLLPDGCRFDRKALHVVFRNELNGYVVAYQFPPSASTANVYAAARSFLKVSNSISLRLWPDLPWIGRKEKDGLPASGDAYTACRHGLKNRTIAVHAINYDSA